MSWDSKPSAQTISVALGRRLSIRCTPGSLLLNDEVRLLRAAPAVIIGTRISAPLARPADAALYNGAQSTQRQIATPDRKRPIRTGGSNHVPHSLFHHAQSLDERCGVPSLLARDSRPDCGEDFAASSLRAKPSYPCLRLQLALRWRGRSAGRRARRDGRAAPQPRIPGGGARR